MNAISIFKRAQTRRQPDLQPQILPRPKLDCDEAEPENAENSDAVNERQADFNEETRNDTGRIFQIDINRISPNPSQPRKNFEGEAIIRLADSIRRYGILQPLTVRRLPQNDDSSAQAGYQLIAGERRLRAAKLLELDEVPCIVMEADDRLSAELAVIENIQRENLNIFEQAGAIASLIDIYNLTQEQIARQLSMSQSYVANKLRILRLTSKERDLILRHSLTERHARALLKLQEVEQRLHVLDIIISKGLNVAGTEDYIERLIAASEDGDAFPKAKRKMILKDIRIFYNTIDRALDIVKRAGLNVNSRRREVEENIELTIIIPKQYENSRGKQS